MGRIKTTFVKTIAKQLFEDHGEKFSGEFTKNKEVVKQVIDIRSKKLMNVVTGYVTSLKKQQMRGAVGY